MTSTRSGNRSLMTQAYANAARRELSRMDDGVARTAAECNKRGRVEVSGMAEQSGRALLFDIDGTLADTDALHLDAFNQVFAPWGQVFDRARYMRDIQGFSNPVRR